MNNGEPHGCLRPDALRSYLEDRLEDGERRRYEEHLSRCRACRRRLVAAYDERQPIVELAAPERLLRQARALPWPPRRAVRRGRWMALAAIVVAGLGASLLLRLDGVSTPPDPETLRSTGRNEPVVLLAPAEGATVKGATVKGAELRFSWRSVPGTRRATLRIVDDRGRIVAERRTQASSEVVTSEEVAGRPELFWYVVLDLGDGTSLESAPRRLVGSVDAGERRETE